MIQSLDGVTIAVSKLCCPVCWEFLALLRGKECGNFGVRGHHNRLFPVDLPEWLPPDIIRSMLNIFRPYLYEQLRIFRKNRTMTYSKTHKPKNDSKDSTKSAMSTQSFGADMSMSSSHTETEHGGDGGIHPRVPSGDNSWGIIPRLLKFGASKVK
jgi:hypothetical protein